MFPIASTTIFCIMPTIQFTTPTKDAFYPPIQQSHSSMVGTDLDSPADPSSPDSLQSDTHSSTKDSQLNTFGYPTSPKSISSFVNLAMNTNMSPSLNFPNNTSCTSMYTPPILPVGPTNPMYNYPEFTPSLTGGMSSFGTPGWRYTCVT